MRFFALCVVPSVTVTSYLINDDCSKHFICLVLVSLQRSVVSSDWIFWKGLWKERRAIQELPLNLHHRRMLHSHW